MLTLKLIFKKKKKSMKQSVIMTYVRLGKAHRILQKLLKTACKANLA